MPKLRGFPRTAKTALAVAFSSALLAGAMTTPASAYTYGPYNCGLLNPNNWCQAAERHTYNEGYGWYGGSGSVWVCQKSIDYNYGGQVQISCAYNSTGQSYSYCCLQYHLVYNGDDNRHTIYGSANF